MKRGHGLLIALLLSLVFGTGPAAAADTRSGGIRQADSSKATATVRVLKRISEDDCGDPLLGPSEPRILALAVQAWPAGAEWAPAAEAPLRTCVTPYQARAPPASFVL